MNVIIRNPKRRQVELKGGKRRVQEVLRELGLNPESVLVIRKGEMLTRDEILDSDDTVEILSAISGG